MTHAPQRVAIDRTGDLPHTAIQVVASGSSDTENTCAKSSHGGRGLASAA